MVRTNDPFPRGMPTRRRTNHANLRKFNAPAATLMTSTPFALFAMFSPMLAAGAAVMAVGAPVLVHLLFRKRYQIIPWAAVRFLVVAERRHRRRIDQWLLLALRASALILFLFALIAATSWAESVWQSIWPRTSQTTIRIPPTHHVIVIDASLSMTAKTDNGQTRFDRAIVHAEQLVRASNPGDGYTVLLVADGVRQVVPGPSNDPERVIAELRKVEAGIRKVRASHGTADIALVLPIVADVMSRPSRAYTRRQLTIFTDLQRSSWVNALPQPHEKTSTAPLWEQVLSRADVAVIDVARTDNDNLAIADLELADGLALINTPVAVHATVVNLGRTERKQVRVELLLGRPSSGNDSLVVVEQKVLETLPPNGRHPVTFELDGPNQFRERGVHVLRVQLVESDDLPADDTRALAVEARDGLRVILVDGNRGETDENRRAAGKLLRAFYPPGAKDSTTPIRPREVSADELLNPTLCDLSNVDCVFLCDVFAPTPELANRLESVLRRGGTVVIGLGPNAAATRDQYNAVLYRGGHGLLPGPLGETITASPDTSGFRLAAEESDYRKPPLTLFASDRARAGLISAPFHTYIRLEAPPERARRIFTFVRSGTDAEPTARRPDPALVEYPQHRGYVYIYTSSFNLDWNGWAGSSTLTYLPFWHEFVRFAAVKPDRYTLQVGERIEEFFPVTAVELTSTLHGPEGLTAILPITLRDQAGIVQFTDTSISGLYRLGLSGSRDRVFAVNVSTIKQETAGESDLTRLDARDLQQLHTNTALGPVQVVHEPQEIKPTARSGATHDNRPKPHGPWLARVAVMAALIVLCFELFLAWKFGPSCSGIPARATAPRTPGRSLPRLIGSLAALALVIVAGFVLFAVFDALRTNNPLGFFNQNTKSHIEAVVGVPTAAAGEATRWRLVSDNAFFRHKITDRRFVAILAGIFLVVTLTVYRFERKAFGRDSKSVSFPSWLLNFPLILFAYPLMLFAYIPQHLVLPALARCTVILLALYVLLPQLRLGFDREGLPEIVILIDVSGSMGTVDDFKDPAVRTKVTELAARLADDPDLKDKLPPSASDRLLLARAILTNKDNDWLFKLLKEKEVKVSVFVVGERTRFLGTFETPTDAETGRKLIASEVIARQKPGQSPPEWERRPLDNASKLGDGIEAVLAQYAGRPLAGIIMFTDGVTTAGHDLPAAARAAALDGVPLYLIGTGDPWEPPDLMLTDLQVEDVIGLGDQLVFQARLTARGDVPRGPVTIRLKERMSNGGFEDRERITVTIEPSGNPVLITMAHTPVVSEAEQKDLADPTGKKAILRRYALVADSISGETNTRNNGSERAVLITGARLVRVLYIEGYPRYDFRFVKVMLERESAESAGGKSIDLKVILLDASRDWAATDLSGFRGDFPTRAELMDERSGFDVVILGDVDPKQLPPSAARDLTDFVQIKGGGLLVLNGQHNGPAAFMGTPLADVLPIFPLDAPSADNPETTPLTRGFQPKLTDAGRLHPIFRFSPNEHESAAIWNQLEPLYWYSKNYRRKPTANVLAVHPEQIAFDSTTGELHPLVLHHYSGAGPVLFLGFDDTWRWRFRAGEVYFERFWMQAIRGLKRARVKRPEVRVLPKIDFHRNDKMTVQVRFPIEAPPPSGDSIRITMNRWPLSKSDIADPFENRPPVEIKTLLLPRVPGPTAQYEFTLTDVPEGEYRFELTDFDGVGARPFATARVEPPLTELARTDMNRADLIAAATISGGRFYTLATADEVFNDLKNFRRVLLNEQADSIPIWNHPLTYALLMLLLMTEWLLRKRERLL